MDSAQRSCQHHKAEPAYPDDFPERMAVVQQLLKERRDLLKQQEYPRRQLQDPTDLTLWQPVIIAVGAMIAGILLAVAGLPLPGIVVGLLGVTGSVLALRRYQKTRRASDAVRENLQRNWSALENQLNGVPNVEDPESIDFAARLRQFRDRQAREEDLREARKGLEGAVSDARLELQRNEGELPRSPNDLRASLRDRIMELRNQLATTELAIEQTSSLDLPKRVAREATGIRDALRSTRTEKKELEGQLAETHQELRERGRPETSAALLEHELASLRERKVEIDRTTTVLRSAYQLIGDAYEQFRERDQERLADQVSRHLDVVSGGALGPLSSVDDLKKVQVRAFGREVPLKYRPLSYGQWHAALLAIRLGTADFLAHAGIRVPLIIDEPFANLDDHYDEAVWKSLQQVARERQVIVTTQERAILERFGLEADIVFD